MPKPLSDVRILELGQLIAGPFAAKILAEFGAEVIKVEPPKTGDPLRKWRLLHKGTSVWWAVQSRNKQSLALDLRQKEAQNIIKQLISECDVLIENFKPGTLEQWGLGWDELHKINPQLIMLRVSGYGQTGPYKDRPGFGLVGEAMGGLRHLSGEPGRAPVRVGVSIGDSLSALHGVIGVLLALRQRDKDNLGQYIDVALYESVFNMMESLLPEYSVFNEIRQPAGSALPGITPSNAYLSKDHKYALIAGNGDSIFQRLTQAMQRPDLGQNPLYAHNDGRAQHAQLIDAAIADWACQYTLEELLQILHEHRIPAGRVYDIEDIYNDPHYQAREMILESELDDGTPVAVPGVVPKLSRTPGALTHKAPQLGQHTAQILTHLGIDAATQQKLHEAGIIDLGNN